MLVGYTFVKMLLQWPVTSMIVQHHVFSWPRSWIGKIVLAPAFLADAHLGIFYGLVIAVLLLMLYTQPNYVLNILFLWITASLYFINLPAGNGADVVLLVISAWCIGLAKQPRFTSDTGILLQTTVHNVSRLLCQIQVILIYLTSGWDKLTNAAWRSGLAWDEIRHFDTLANPLFDGMLEGRFWNVAFAWITIVFECVFGLLIYNKRTRIPAIMVGIAFHLGIWILLSLPDFGLIMIVSYLVFLEDEDYERLLKKWKTLNYAMASSVGCVLCALSR